MLVDPSLRYYASENALKAIEWTESALDRSGLEFIASLPITSELEDGVLLVHGSPRHPDEYIADRNTLRDSIYALEEMERRICFYGHTHVPAVYDDLNRDSYKPGKEIVLDPTRMYLVNPGSVGQPRDRDKRGSFCLYDPERRTVKFERFDYDIKSASEMILAKGLPQGLATRLYYGM
jgi:diadenosine tetraphosphatase ApaH/serine/threonine PP2A family protein phosphatase